MKQLSLAVIVFGIAGQACSASDEASGAAGSGGASAASGGAANGGTTTVGGTSTTAGGTSNGGTSNGGSSGGTLAGGSPGSTSGGAANGGTVAAGASSGGAPTAGAGFGGVGAGGAGGTASAGTSGGGAAAGSPSVGGGTGGPSAGCGKNTTAPSASVQQTLQINGKTRYYLLYVPSAYSASTPIPLLFGFHGRGGNNHWVANSKTDDWFGHFGLQAATAGKAIIVFPQGTGDPPGNSADFSGESFWYDDANDVGFFDALVADIQAKYCIDTSRVFATGYSMGGAFSNTLACKRSSVLRAIAPVAAWGPNSSPGGTTANCASAQGDEAVMAIHGMKDATIAFESGKASAESWRKSSSCSATTTASSDYPSCNAYQGCRVGGEVLFCPHAGDHQVPKDAGAKIWKFFEGLK